MPRKTSANAPVAKLTKATATKNSQAPKATTASKKATKSTAEKAATSKSAAVTTASKKGPTAKSAEAVAKANTSKKRQRDDEEEEDEEEGTHEQAMKPQAKKAKVTAAPKVTKSKPAALKAKTTSSKAATAKAVKPKSTGAKHTTEEAAAAIPVSKKAKTTASKKNYEAREKSEKESDDATSEDAKALPAKKAAPKKAALPKKTVDPIVKIKIGAKINTAPTTPLDVFVFGEGSAGELGLGAKVIDKKRPIDVKRPRKNPLLSSPEVGVVQLACGGMHGLALTKNNKILSWGVNDQGALGRSTKWDGGLRDVDASGSDSEDEADDDTGLNPLESTPTEIDTSGIAPGTKFVQVAGCDSASFALTEDGRVYGWGTFRVGLTAHKLFAHLTFTNTIHSLEMAFLGFHLTSTSRKSLFCCPSPPRSCPSRLAPITS